MINPVIANKILFIAGFANILFILLILLTCRCLGVSKLSSKLSHYNWYKKLYAKHCYFWWLFFISVIIHTFLAFYLFGFNF